MSGDYDPDEDLTDEELDEIWRRATPVEVVIRSSGLVAWTPGSTGAQAPVRVVGAGAQHPDTESNARPGALT